MITYLTLYSQCNGNGGKQFGANMVFIIAVTAWVGVFAVLIFGILSVSEFLSQTENNKKFPAA